MIRGILITAKCHMHVPRSHGNLYTELKNKRITLSRVGKKEEKKTQKQSLV